MNISIISTLIISICQIVIGTYILRSPNIADKSVKINFTLLSYYMAFWCLSFFIASLTINYSTTLLWSRLTVIGALYFPLHYMLFVRGYLGIDIKRKSYLYYYLSLGILLIISLFSSLYVNDVKLLSPGYDFFPGKVYYVVPFLFLFFIMCGLYMLFTGYKNQDKIKQNQIAYILIGTFISFVIGSISNVILPLINIRQFNYLGPLSTVFYTISVAYVLTKYHLMDVSIVISRAVAEMLTILFHTLIYLALVWFYTSSIINEIGFPFIVLTIVYGLVVGLTHQKIRLFIQTTSDKVFLRGKYDYYKELAGIGSEILRSVSKKDVINTLNKTFYNTIEVSNPRIYLDKELDKPDIASYLSYKEPVFIRKTLVLPCIIENKPVAMIILGPKLSEDPYTDEDVRLLSNIASQTAIALDHIRVYEEMLAAKKQLMAADKLSLLGKVAVKLASEIKKPLEAIKEMSSGIESGINDKQYLLRYTEVVPKEIDRMNRIVEDVLILSRTKSK